MFDGNGIKGVAGIGQGKKRRWLAAAKTKLSSLLGLMIIMLVQQYD